MLEVNPRPLVTGTKIIKENSGKISKGQRVNQGSEIGKKNVLFHLTFEEKKWRKLPLRSNLNPCSLPPSIFKCRTSSMRSRSLKSKTCEEEA